MYAPFGVVGEHVSISRSHLLARNTAIWSRASQPMTSPAETTPNESGCLPACDHLTKTPNLVFIGDTNLCCELRKFTGQSGQEALCCRGIVSGDDGMPSAVGLMG